MKQFQQGDIVECYHIHFRKILFSQMPVVFRIDGFEITKGSCYDFSIVFLLEFGPPA